MRVIVDEMPENTLKCKYHGYNYFIEKDICNKDYDLCNLDTSKKICRFYKEENKVLKDDCK